LQVYAKGKGLVYGDLGCFFVGVVVGVVRVMLGQQSSWGRRLQPMRNHPFWGQEFSAYVPVSAFLVTVFYRNFSDTETRSET
jgi:hypothetical protein